MCLKVEYDSRRACVLFGSSCYFIFSLLEFQSTYMLQLPPSRARRLHIRSPGHLFALRTMGLIYRHRMKRCEVCSGEEASCPYTWACPLMNLPVSAGPNHANFDDDSSPNDCLRTTKRGILKPTPPKTFAPLSKPYGIWEDLLGGP